MLIEIVMFGFITPSLLGSAYLGIFGYHVAIVVLDPRYG